MVRPTPLSERKTSGRNCFSFLDFIFASQFTCTDLLSLGLGFRFRLTIFCNPLLVVLFAFPAFLGIGISVDCNFWKDLLQFSQAYLFNPNLCLMHLLLPSS